MSLEMSFYMSFEMPLKMTFEMSLKGLLKYKSKCHLEKSQKLTQNIIPNVILKCLEISQKFHFKFY